MEAGVSILPRESVRREAGAGELAYARFHDSGKWVRPLAVIRRRGRGSSPAERMFLDVLRTEK